MADTPSDAPIPPPLPEDPEDVSWALSTAGAMWGRGDLAEAVKWLRRGAEAASEAEQDDRALQLAKVAADLAGQLGAGGSPSPHAARPSGPTAAAKPTPAAPAKPAAAAPAKPAAAKVPAAPKGARPAAAPRPAAALLVRGTPRGGAAKGAERSDSAPPRSVPTPTSPSRRPPALPVPSSALESGRFRAVTPTAPASGDPSPPAERRRRGPPPLPRTDDEPAAVTDAPFPMDDDDDTFERHVEDIWPPTRVEAARPMSSGRELAAAPVDAEPAADAPEIGEPGAMRAPAASATDWDALPTRARLEALAPAAPAAAAAPGRALGDDDDDSGTNPSQDPHVAPSTPAPSRAGAPALVTSQAVRVVLWKDANGVHVAPQGTLVRAITVEAMLVALDPSADLGAWLDPAPPKG